MNFPPRGTAWAYVGMTLAGVASIAANVLHAMQPANPPAGSVIAAGLWPVFLFVAIEILAKHEWPDGARWVAIRVFGLVPVAAVSAVVSYRHMNGLLAHWGEDAVTATIGPLAVDGLLVMSTGAIIAAGMAKALPVPLEVPAVEPEDDTDDEQDDEETPYPLLGNATDRKVYAALDGQTLGASELARAADLHLSTTKNALARLLEQGHVVKDGTSYRRRTAA